MEGSIKNVMDGSTINDLDDLVVNITSVDSNKNDLDGSTENVMDGFVGKNTSVDATENITVWVSVASWEDTTLSPGIINTDVSITEKSDTKFSDLLEN
jgi:hypothetical protein